MPYVRRDAGGNITLVTRAAEPGAEEWLAPDDPQMRAFLGAGQESDEGFTALDADFIRVLEDLLDTLIDKGVIRLTDLPQNAQQKLLARKSYRGRMHGGLDLLDDEGMI